MAKDLKLDQIKISKLIFSSSALVVHNSSVSSNDYGDVTSTLFDQGGIGTDVIVYVSGTKGTKNSVSKRGVFVIDGDLHVSGVAYNADGEPLGTGAGGGIGTSGQSFFNHIALSTDSSTDSDTLLVVGASEFNQTEYLLDLSTPHVYFNAISYITNANLTGTIQLHDLTDDVVLCSFVITSSTPHLQRVEVTTTDGNLLETRIKVDGGSLSSDKLICLGTKLEFRSTID